MPQTSRIDVENGDILTSLRGFLGSLLSLEEISALLVPSHLPGQKVVMPTLITDPGRLQDIDPLAPCFALNGAKIVSRLTRKAAGAKVAVVLRSCELRAFIELVKLKQGQPNDLVIVGIDCLGAFNNRDYGRFVDAYGAESTQHFITQALSGNFNALNGVDLAPACKVCELPIAQAADLMVGLIGVDVQNGLMLQAGSQKGQDCLKRLGLADADEPTGRKTAIADLVARRTAARDDMFAATASATHTLEKLSAYLSGCVNCYNCRVACPVCYCKECVFVTDVFNHEPSQYLKWAERKGAIKMPTDTVFYHMTRLAHMSTACVGCGQCSNACPNDISVMELFRTVAHSTQQAFDYQAGRSLADSPPLSVFREDEFQNVVGIHAT